MKTFMYVCADGSKNISEVQGLLRTYMADKGVVSDQVVEDAQPMRMNWRKREIGKLLLGGIAMPGDAIVMYEASDIARSTCQLLEILIQATQGQIDIHFVKYGEIFKACAVTKLNHMLRIMQNVESDFLSHRTTEALAKRRASGLPLGRPKGRKNRYLKLDAMKSDIVRYLSLGLSRSSVAKLVQCHPQTLYLWIERHGVAYGKSSRKVETSVG